MLQFIATLILIVHLGSVEARPDLNLIPLLEKETTQSSVAQDWDSYLAIDGNKTTWSQTIAGHSNQPWWKVDMGDTFTVTFVSITRPGKNRRLKNVQVTVDGRPCNPLLVTFMEKILMPCSFKPRGRYLMIQLLNTTEVLPLSEVMVFGHREPVELVKVNMRGLKTIQSSVYKTRNSSLAVDDNSETWSQTAVGQLDPPWWAVDLQGSLAVDNVLIINRQGRLHRLGFVQVTVDDQPCEPKFLDAGVIGVRIYCPQQPRGRYLKIELQNVNRDPRRDVLTLSEVKVFGYNYTESDKLVEPGHTRDVMGLTCNDEQGNANCTVDDINILYKALIANVDDFNIPKGRGRSIPTSIHPNALHIFPNDQFVNLGCLTPVGKGWIYFVGHESAIIKSISTTFYKNLITYLAQGDQVDASEAYLSYVRNNLGYPNSKKVGNDQLQDTDVYICGANDLDENVGKFVRQGGILITGGYTWHLKKALDSAFNRVFWRDGVAYLADKNSDGHVVYPKKNQPMTILAALELIQVQQSATALQFDLETAKALDVLGKGLKAMSSFPNVLGSVPRVASLYEEVTSYVTNNTALWSINLPIIKSERVPFALLTLQSGLNAITPKDKKFPIPTMSYWPGPVKESIPRVTMNVTIDLNYRHIDSRFAYGIPLSWGIKHTGLYASPNEEIVITIPKDLIGLFNVRIGLWSDSLWGKNSYYRFPDPLVTESKLSEATTVIYSPHGGQIVFMVPENKWRERVITISGGVEMMSYTYGKTDQTTFKASVQGKEFPPFAEYHFNGGVFNLPTDGFNTTVDLDVMGEYWSNVIGAYNRFANNTVHRYRPEEFACDIQISVGAGHSGYPAMGTLNWAISMFGIVSEPKSGWGLRHEFGHNYQLVHWILPNWGETSNNFMSLYFEKSVLNYTRWDHENVIQLSGSRRLSLRRDWCSKPQTAAPENFYVNLELLVQLVDRFGWDPLIEHSGEFMLLPLETPLLDSEKKKYSEWFERFCNIVKRNLTPQLVGIWKWPVSISVQRKMGRYRAWVHPDMKDCKFGA